MHDSTSTNTSSRNSDLPSSHSSSSAPHAALSAAPAVAATPVMPATLNTNDITSSSSPTHHLHTRRDAASLSPSLSASAAPDSLSLSSATATATAALALASTTTRSPHWWSYLTAGAIAGLSVDLVLFPLDTIKTRMQSVEGFRRSGGFRGLGAGLASAAAGSAPGAALFFVTYEAGKARLERRWREQQEYSAAGAGVARSASISTLHTSTPVAPIAPPPLVHCLSASLAEVVACLIRVPTENVKQKVQAGHYSRSLDCARSLWYSSAGPFPREFYRGYATTVLREIPFAFIQFPLYERMRIVVARRREQKRIENLMEEGHRISASALSSRSSPSSSSSTPITAATLDGWTCACIGSASGGFAAALTTPLDVVKTRLMLHRHQQPTPSTTTTSVPPHVLPAVPPSASATITAASSPSSSSTSSPSVLRVLTSLYREGGIVRLFSGVLPRTMWMSLGGFVFFGAYEGTKQIMHDTMNDE